MVLRDEVFREEGGGVKKIIIKWKTKPANHIVFQTLFGFSPLGKLLDKNWLSLSALCIMLGLPDSFRSGDCGPFHP